MSYRILTLIVSLVLILVSCSDYLEGKKQEEAVLRLNGKQFACLDGVAERFRNIMAQNSRPEEVEASLDCLASSLEYFKKKTKGSYDNPNIYTVENVRSFFSDYFGDHNRFSDKMGSELMKVKKALFGGNDKALSKAELQNLIDFIGDLKVEVRKLRPHWGLVLTKSDVSVSREALESANRALEESLKTLLSKTQLAQNNYSFQDFKSLIHETEIFIQNAPAGQSVQINKWLPLIESVKNILFGEMVEMSSPEKWQHAITTVTEIHKFYLLYKYQYNKSPLISRVGTRVGDEMLNSLFTILDRSWVLQKGEIPFESTQNLFQALKDQDLLPKDVSVKGADDTYRAIVLRVLEREKQDPKETVTGLEKKHVRVLKTEYEIWRTAQNFIEQMPDTFSYNNLLTNLKAYTPSMPTRFKIGSQSVLEEGWKDWVSHLSQDLPLMYLPSGDLVIGHEVRSLTNVTWYSLARLNMMRTLARVLQLGYGQKRTQIMRQEYLVERGMSNWYDDFAKLGEDIKAFDSRTLNSGPRSFFESDHFTYASNGDEILTYQETFEFVNIIFSAGLGGVKNIQDSLKANGCTLNENDIFGNPWSKEDCFKKLLRKDFAKFFKNLKGLREYVAGMNDQQWDEFYSEVIYFSRFDEKQKGLKVETADIRTFVVILHYIESMYIKFDTNRDGFLSQSELIPASQRFVQFFKVQKFSLRGEPKTMWEKAMHAMSEKVIPHAFACMVLTGEMPSLFGCAKIYTKNVITTQKSTRLEILRTLNAFKSAIK